MSAIDLAEAKVVPPDDEEDAFMYRSLYEGRQFVDDLSGAKLETDGVIKARALEMAFFKRLKVYIKVRVNLA